MFDISVIECFKGVIYDRKELLAGDSIEETKILLEYCDWKDVDLLFFSKNQSIFNYLTPSAFRFLAPAMIVQWRNLEKVSLASEVVESFCVALTRELNPFLVDDLLESFTEAEINVIIMFFDFLENEPYPPLYLKSAIKTIRERK